MNRRPQLTIVAPDSSPEEAAAVVAALERFMRETAPVLWRRNRRAIRGSRPPSRRASPRARSSRCPGPKALGSLPPLELIEPALVGEPRPLEGANGVRHGVVESVLMGAVGAQ